MRPLASLSLGSVLLLSGCTNYIYEGQLTARDASGKQRHFVLYWSKTDPLLGTSKAGPAVLLTECSTTRIDFADRPQGIIFRGEPGRDRLSAKTASQASEPTCGRILGYPTLADVAQGNLLMEIDCTPISDEFSVRRRDYLKARAEPYLLRIVEKAKHWSLLGETLPAPVLTCPHTAAH